MYTHLTPPRRAIASAPRVPPTPLHSSARSHRRIRVMLATVAVLGALGLSTPANARDIAVDWTDGFGLTAGAVFDNPLLWFLFNPQPEPPREAILDLLDPTKPTITVPFDSGQMFHFGFGIAGNGSYALSGPGAGRDDPLPASPDASGDFNFQAHFAGPSPGVFDVLLNIQDSSGPGASAPSSWVAFNPQPEPPLFMPGGSLLGAEFGFASTSPAVLTIQILDSGTGDALRLASIPEPATFALLGLGLAGIGFSRKRRRH